MTVTSGDPAGDNEVDEARWVTLDQAASQLSYHHDVEVVAALPSALGA